MTQFKTVVEDFRSDLKKLTEAMQQGFDTLGTELHYVKADVRYLKDKADSHAAQIALLHEDTTEIKNSLKQKNV